MAMEEGVERGMMENKEERKAKQNWQWVGGGGGDSSRLTIHKLYLPG